jgi:hypothetical protein
MKKVMFTAIAVGLSLSVSIMAQVPSYVPTNGLVGWWPFNGNANDESGNGNNGTVNGATLTTDRFGNAGKAYNFDGVDDRIEMAEQNFSSLNFSINLWLNKADSTGFGNIIGKSNWIDSQSEGFGLCVNENIISSGIKDVSCNPGIWSLSTVNKPNNFDNFWNNLTLTFDGNSQKLYLNSILIFDSVVPNGGLNCSGGKIKVGAWWQDEPLWFKGKIDDIGIWNRTLTDQEVSDLYNGNNVGINDKNQISEIIVYPNPTNDHITIDAGDLATMNGYSIKIEDAQGQQVFQNAVNQQQFYVDITTWGGNGLYFVRIIDPQGNTVDIKKIVLQ